LKFTVYERKFNILTITKLHKSNSVGTFKIMVSVFCSKRTHPGTRVRSNKTASDKLVNENYSIFIDSYDS